MKAKLKRKLIQRGLADRIGKVSTASLARAATLSPIVTGSPRRGILWEASYAHFPKGTRPKLLRVQPLDSHTHPEDLLLSIGGRTGSSTPANECGMCDAGIPLTIETHIPLRDPKTGVPTGQVLVQKTKPGEPTIVDQVDKLTRPSLANLNPELDPSELPAWALGPSKKAFPHVCEDDGFRRMKTGWWVSTHTTKPRHLIRFPDSTDQSVLEVVGPCSDASGGFMGLLGTVYKCTNAKDFLDYDPPAMKEQEWWQAKLKDEQVLKDPDEPKFLDQAFKKRGDAIDALLFYRKEK